MELQIRGLDRFKGKCPVYLTVEDTPSIGIPVSEILISQGMGNCRIFCKGNQIGTTGYQFSQVQTLIVRCGNGKFLTGCLRGMPSPEILNGEFQVYSVNADIRQTSDETKEPPAQPKPEELVSASMDSGQSSASQITYQKIEITDIRKLPKRNWNLCGNSFLVHGFFNYHYLILKTVNTQEEPQLFLGVPGVYVQQERMMALLFGFPEFEAASNSASVVSDSKAESDGYVPPQTNTGAFGYWMCPLYSG